MEDSTPKYFNDDGIEFNPNLIPNPALCTTCRKDHDPTQEILCNLIRADQQDEEEFRCDAYEPDDVTEEKVGNLR